MGFVIVFVVSLGSWFGFGQPSVSPQVVQPQSFVVQTPFDLCPDTALGAAVDAFGCAAYQLDADRDGFCSPYVAMGCFGLDFCPGLGGPFNGCLPARLQPFSPNPFLFNQLGGPIF